MLGKNNFKERLRKMEEQNKKDRFSIRKLSIGVASVLIGFTFMGLASQNVLADPMLPNSKPQVGETQTSDSQDNSDNDSQKEKPELGSNSVQSNDQTGTDNQTPKSEQPDQTGKTDENQKQGEQSAQNNQDNSAKSDQQADSGKKTPVAPSNDGDQATKGEDTDTQEQKQGQTTPATPKQDQQSDKEGNTNNTQPKNSNDQNKKDDQASSAKDQNKNDQTSPADDVDKLTDELKEAKALMDTDQYQQMDQDSKKKLQDLVDKGQQLLQQYQASLLRTSLVGLGSDDKDKSSGDDGTQIFHPGDFKGLGGDLDKMLRGMKITKKVVTAITLYKTFNGSGLDDSVTKGVLTCSDGSVHTLNGSSWFTDELNQDVFRTFDGSDLYNKITSRVGTFSGTVYPIKEIFADNVPYTITTYHDLRVTVVVSQQSITATLKGTTTKHFDDQAVTTDEVNSSSSTYDGLKVQFTDPSSESDSNFNQDLRQVDYTLRAGDYLWSTSDHRAPTKCGTYAISLTTQGKIDLQNFIDTKYGKTGSTSNLKLNFANSSGTFKIVESNPTVSIGGSASKTYDGTAVTNAEVISTARGNTIKVSFNNPDHISDWSSISYTLQDGDYFWDTQGFAAPTDAGTYTITLNGDGVRNIQAKVDAKYGKGTDGSSNVRLFSGGSATFTIKRDTATATLNANNKQTATFSGNDISIDWSKFAPTLASGSGKTTPTMGSVRLGADDFTIKDDKGNVVTSVKKCGTYTVALNNTGLSKLSSNYTWTTSGTGKIIVNQAFATATLSGSASKTFNNKTVTTGEVMSTYGSNNIKISFSSRDTINGLSDVSYSLLDGDYTWNTSDHRAPKKVGTYTITLTDHGRQAIQNLFDNKYGKPNVSDVHIYIAGSATFKITKASSVATLGGSASKTYDDSAVTLGEVTSTAGSNDIKITFSNPDSVDGWAGVSYTLQAGDYTWNTSDRNAPKDAGTYTITLTAAGKSNLKAAVDAKMGAGNVTLEDGGSATFKIKQASSTATLSGSTSMEYTGSGATTSAVNDHRGGVIKISFSNPDNINGVRYVHYYLKDGDYTWNTSDHTAPTELGTYTITLT